MSELVRDSGVVTKSVVSLSNAKEGLLRVYTAATRVDVMERLADMDNTSLKIRKDEAIRILNDASSAPELRTQASSFMGNFFNVGTSSTAAYLQLVNQMEDSVDLRQIMSRRIT